MAKYSLPTIAQFSFHPIDQKRTLPHDLNAVQLGIEQCQAGSARWPVGDDLDEPYFQFSFSVFLAIHAY